MQIRFDRIAPQGCYNRPFLSCALQYLYSPPPPHSHSDHQPFKIFHYIATSICNSDHVSYSKHNQVDWDRRQLNGDLFFNQHNSTSTSYATYLVGISPPGLSLLKPACKPYTPDLDRIGRALLEVCRRLEPTLRFLGGIV
ncbi:hypothetical protein [Candidatus Chloroploca asiatica]|uniref:hypothetical protein n=1 Tax=Candidatus Chloroploca asiatica TaxID=1506545 RepID=UPI001142CE15|nr:hypothetical protein [Candidatus Chloroploca asiatica]